MEHLAGFQVDVENASYTSLSTTLNYCWRLAGVVGVMLSLVMGRRDAATLYGASDLGMAFQLTNIARDVVENAANNRVNLPSEWLQAEGIYSTAHILVATKRAALGRVAARLVDAQPILTTSWQARDLLPCRCDQPGRLQQLAPCTVTLAEESRCAAKQPGMTVSSHRCPSSSGLLPVVPR